MESQKLALWHQDQKQNHGLLDIKIFFGSCSKSLTHERLCRQINRMIEAVNLEKARKNYFGEKPMTRFVEHLDQRTDEEVEAYLDKLEIFAEKYSKQTL